MDWQKHQVAAIIGLTYSEENELNKKKKHMIENLNSYCDSHMKRMIDFIHAAESLDELSQIYKAMSMQ